MKKAEPCASSGGESLFYTVAPALHSAEAGPLQEMDKDLPAGRVKIDRPVVPFRGKFIGCPYRSLLCPTKALTKSGGKFYKWNSSGSAKGVPSVRGNLPTLALSIGSGFTGFFMAKIYGNGEVCNGIFSPFRPRDIYISKLYSKRNIFEFFFLDYLQDLLSKAVEYQRFNWTRMNMEYKGIVETEFRNSLYASKKKEKEKELYTFE